MAMDGYVDDMMCEGLFDNIEDLLDFSTDDEALGMRDSSAPSAAAGGGSDDGAIQVASVAVSPAAASFPSSDGEGCRVSANSDETKICDEINIHEDWITNFLDDSNFDIDFPAATGIIAAAAGPPSNGDISGSGSGNGNGRDDDSLFQSFSPVSVLDEPNNLSSSIDRGGFSSSSSSSSSTSSSRTNGKTASTVSLAMAPVGPTMMLVPARARSKRPRRAAPAPAHVAVPIVPPASEGPPAVPTLLPECESFGESEPCALPLMMMKKKKKKIRQNFLAGNAGGGGDDTTAVRKCQHCGIQKTPQWRAGPTGPKTLCNACGVRYKSGRLFPEYRPAASPTFVPSIHSNSHKKVVEMRIKACQHKAANGMPSPVYPAAKNCDLLAYIRRQE